MKLIIGVGNPGEKYKNTRHNVGYRFVEAAAKNLKFKILKTNVFMNESGKFVKNLSKVYKLQPADLYIVHDDLDIKLGEYKITQKSPKDHKGINSIKDVFGTDDFWKIRIGVDARDQNDRMPGEEYVLQNFTEEEKKVIGKVIDEICKKLEALLGK